MRVCQGTLLLVAGLAVAWTAARADDVKSEAKHGGAFNIKAITGDSKGKEFCYVWQYNNSKSAVVLIFSNKADEHLAGLVKAVDEVQKSNAKLGTVVVGLGDVKAADLEKLQETHKLTTPLTVMQKGTDAPKGYNLSKEAGVTVLVYQNKDKKGAKVFAFSDSKSAAAKAKDIAKAAEEALK